MSPSSFPPRPVLRWRCLGDCRLARIVDLSTCFEEVSCLGDIFLLFTSSEVIDEAG